MKIMDAELKGKKKDQPENKEGLKIEAE